MGGNRAAAGAGETAATIADVSFLEADVDGDARVTAGEFNVWRQRSARALDRFEAGDTNGDGVLTLDEWQRLVRRPSAAAGGSAPAPGVRR